ncbi:MAG: hypothetical protein MUF38_09030 [Anaerolineae bacterium]|nr:hypothetical protein [Anaerolineae bacterium]
MATVRQRHRGRPPIHRAGRSDTQMQDEMTAPRLPGRLWLWTAAAHPPLC